MEHTAERQRESLQFDLFYWVTFEVNESRNKVLDPVINEWPIGWHLLRTDRLAKMMSNLRPLLGRSQ